MIQLGPDGLVISELFEASVDGIFLLDDDCRVFSWNKKMKSLTGFDQDLVKGKHIFNLSGQFKRTFFIEALKSALNNEGSVLSERLVFPVKGSFVYCQASISPFSLPYGEGIGCMVVLRQLNESKKESRFKPLVEESPIATAIYDRKGQPKYFNKAYGKIWGASTKISSYVLDSYNILEDIQLVDLGIMPFIEKAFAGETCEIPAVSYNPEKTPALKNLGLDEYKFVKGHLFPIVNAERQVEEVVLVLNDVTFQKQAEQILSDTHAKFQKLTHGLPGVIYEYEEIGENPHTFRYISEGCQDMFGFSPEEILANSALLENRIHSEDIDSYRQSMRNSEFGARNWAWQGRIVVNNVTKWIEGKSSPTKLNDGSIVRYGLLLDITDKKEVERQYKLTEERLQLALDGADLGLWEWEHKKGKFLLNKSWAHKLGYDHSEFNKHFSKWESLVHPEDLEVFNTKTEQFSLGTKEVVEFEYRMKTKSGEWVWVLDRGKVIERTKTGKVKRASGTILDVNKSKITQQLIKQNEQLFTQLFENAPLGLVLLDDKHQVVQMNQGFVDMFGYTQEEVIGNQLNNIIVPDASVQESIDINTLTSKGTVGILESHRLHKNGNMVPVIIYGVPISYNETTIGIYGIYVNIAERVKAEKELQIRNNELDNFVYKVSHDLRAPLSSILGLVHLANHEQNEDDLKEYIAIIENRVKQLDSFINDVLSHSKNLKMDVKVDEINFKEIIDNCYAELSYLPHSQNVLRKIAIDGPAFYSDVWRIKEVFRNLISNAIKYADPEKDCSFISLDITITEEQATIRVEDNGIGIDDESLPKIFEMFYRATTKAEGSGIGLYIVKNAIEKLGGQVELESKADEGTIFNIILPNQCHNAEIKA
ncbi:PAS domain S-box protein [Fulvivirga lutea]|uniref:histidine kinase n=1 Tax=Fulvivirga lutea TaxID=2810512 RepID=A0A974WI65_9BACT|nr:PAS domain S-box protein [Fulvivirga lutea]QSE98359.1 PAS domain S-box protein [Fulvivirga lutea]